MKKYSHCGWFAICYTVLFIVMMYKNLLTGYWSYILLAPVGLMIWLILAYQNNQDEVLKKMNNHAYMIGFWGVFIALLAAEMKLAGMDAVMTMIPIWAVPLLGWNLGYLVSWVRNK